MNLLAHRSRITVMLAAGILLVTIPFAIRDRIVTGDLYLFTERFFEDLLLRVTGPGRFRFILQPIMATLLALRDGRADAKAGRPVFLRRLFHPEHPTKGLVREVAASVGTLLAMAIVIDMVVQLVFLGSVHPFAALLLGPVLVVAPYAIVRTITGGLTRRG